MASPALPDIAKAEIAIVEMTNTFRKDQGLAGVAPNPQLVNAARAFAAYIARTDNFAHDADGRQPAERAESAGYRYCYIAENLALNQSSAGFETRKLARRMVEGWINSPGHRKNMLAEHATETGVAIAKGPEKDPKFIAVQLFGRPKSLAYEFQISNSSGEPVTYSFGGKSHDLKPSLGVVHTACLPDTVVFEKSGGSKPVAVNARYEARDGQLFLLQKKPGGGVVVEVKQKERVR